MADPTDIKNAPGYDSTMSGYSAVTQSMQTLATEMQRMSKETMDTTSQLMDKLRSAKTAEEVVSIQTSFMQQSFASYADFSRRFGEVIMAVPMELAKTSQATFQQGTDAMTRATEQAREQMQEASEQVISRG